VSSNDFDGPPFRPAGGQGADDQGAGANNGGGQGAGGNGAGGARYPAPEGWGNDGFWRDSSIDADYETSTNALRPAGNGPHGDPGYSYFSDGNGWQNAQAKAARPGQAADATSFDATRAVFPAGQTGPVPPGGFGAPVGPAAPAGPGGPWQGGSGGYGSGGYGSGGYGSGGYGMPAGPGGPPGPGWPGGPVGPGGPGGPVGPGGPGGPGGPRRPGGHAAPGKRKGNWWRHWTWKKALAITGGLVLIFVLGMFSVYEYLSSSTTIPAALASANYQNTTVYYSDGKTVIGTIGETNRQDLTYGQIPMQLQDAVVAAEDKNFWTEGGISPTGIMRAAYHDLTNSGNLNGGSTITQEFVKNYYDGVGSQQTASRKIKEIFIAKKLASTKSKQWIMTNFLNLIYLGKNSYGVEAAAQTYFGKPVSKLTWAQDAFIGGIIQAPSTYPLLSNRPQMIARWKYVVQQMVLDKYITAAQASTMTFPKLLTDSATSTSNSGASVAAASADPWAAYILDVVYNELTSPRSVGGDGVPTSQVETGGLKIVTTISNSMEKEIYKAVDANIAAIKATPGAQFPSYIRIGAELQNPANGEILAMYPGPGQAMSAKQCAVWDCDLNTATYTREQVGSSFKPYVLSAAVADGMNVQTSTLNANQYLCVPKDTEPMVLSSTKVTWSNGTEGCPASEQGYFPVENDGGEIIGDPKKGGGTTVQNALAQSSNTAFTDLTHRVTTTNVINIAKAFGVNIADYPNGSGLTSDHGDTNIALGIAPLTVNEQATMLSAIADNGVYHQSHIIKYWQQPNGPQQQPSLDSHGVLDPTNPTVNAQLDSQVQYAMEMTTVDGTGTSAAYGLGSRQIIAKTGTTTNSHAGFFIGAIPQYSLVVGMFTHSQDSKSTQSLVPLTGGGFGGYWPAKIWNTFAQAEFANLPQQNFQDPVFTGANWNQVGKITPPKISCWVDGQQVKLAVKTCPTPTPQVSCGYDQQTGQNDLCATCTFNQADGQFDNCGTPTQCSYNQADGQFDQCGSTPSPSATCQYQGDPTCNGATPSPSSTCQNPGDPACATASTNGSGTSIPTTASSTQAGLAVGGGLAALPGAGSALWAAKSRRRRRRPRPDAAR
jgi:membrane peptidoglycan carboxypeptidase